jgi:hypothetical protein
LPWRAAAGREWFLRQRCLAQAGHRRAVMAAGGDWPNFRHLHYGRYARCAGTNRMFPAPPEVRPMIVAIFDQHLVENSRDHEDGRNKQQRHVL